jgi:hypothetical protein
MRTKLFKIAQAATLGFAMTFTISCSGGDDDSPPNGGGNTSGSNLSDLPKQAYIVVWDDDGNIIKKDEYKGTSDITLRISLFADHDCSSSGSTCICTDYSGVEHQCTRDELDGYESKPAGKIQNGQVLLDLPDIESKYLEKFEDNTSFIECKECIDFVIPKNLSGYDTQGISVAIPDKSECWMGLILVGSYRRERRDAVFYYASESGKIIGRYRDYLNFDLNFSKGWNAIYCYDDANGLKNCTTDLSKTGGTLELEISCHDDID